MGSASCHVFCKCSRTAFRVVEAFSALWKAVPQPTMAGICSWSASPQGSRDAQGSLLLLMSPLHWRNACWTPAGSLAQTCLSLLLGMSQQGPGSRPSPTSSPRGWRAADKGRLHLFHSQLKDALPGPVLQVGGKLF